MKSTKCDVCHDPIEQVAYRLQGFNPANPAEVVSDGPDMHWRCVPAYISTIVTEQEQPTGEIVSEDRPAVDVDYRIPLPTTGLM